MANLLAVKSWPYNKTVLRQKLSTPAGKTHYITELSQILSLLHHISWQKIYEKLQQLATAYAEDHPDQITRAFLSDLVLYLEKKEIGYKKSDKGGDRDFEYIFGEESLELIKFLEPRDFKINLSEAPFEIKQTLYVLIQNYIEKLGKSRTLKRTNNTLAVEKIPLEILFEVDPEEVELWSSFIIFLYQNEYVNMNGQSDFSAKLQFSRGNYTKSPISLFRYRRKNRVIEFQKTR